MEVLFIEKQLVVVWCVGCFVFLQEGLEGCDVGVGFDYDDGGCWVGWQVEIFVV